MLDKIQRMNSIIFIFQTTNENWKPSILNEAAKIIYKVMYCLWFYCFFFVWVVFCLSVQVKVMTDLGGK